MVPGTDVTPRMSSHFRVADEPHVHKRRQCGSTRDHSSSGVGDRVETMQSRTCYSATFTTKNVPSVKNGPYDVTLLSVSRVCVSGGARGETPSLSDRSESVTLERDCYSMGDRRSVSHLDNNTREMFHVAVCEHDAGAATPRFSAAHLAPSSSK